MNSKHRLFHIGRDGKREHFDQDGLNTSGLDPVEAKILLLPDRITEEHGGIVIPEVAQQQRQFSQVRALLIAHGANAFEDWDDPPKAGDRVLICKFAGIVDIRGVDGREYQIITDVDVTAKILEEFPEGVSPDMPMKREPLGKPGEPLSKQDYEGYPRLVT